MSEQYLLLIMDNGWDSVTLCPMDGHIEVGPIWNMSGM